MQAGAGQSEEIVLRANAGLAEVEGVAETARASVAVAGFFLAFVLVRFLACL